MKRKLFLLCFLFGILALCLSANCTSAPKPDNGETVNPRAVRALTEQVAITYFKTFQKGEHDA